MKMFILTALFFSFSLNIQASVSCDEKQIKEAKRSHSEDIVGHSIKEIFLHFYQNPDALNKAPYEFLQQGELQGYSTVDNPRSKGKNSYVSNFYL